MFARRERDPDMRVGIVAQKDNPTAAGLADEIRRALDATAVVDEATADVLAGEVTGVPVDRMADCDLVVSIGGDGTFLFAARGAGRTPLMGVNLGEVGFLNATSPDEAVDTVLATVARAREDRMEVVELPRVGARGADWSLPSAINEITLVGRRRGRAGGIDVTVAVDGSRYTETSADGVLVATPTGSTAYNLSERGPLVHPGIEGLVVTPMNGDDAMPPLVVDPEAGVTVEIRGGSGAAVSDGRATRELSTPTRVTVERTEPPVRIAGPDLEFFSALSKLR